MGNTVSTANELPGDSLTRKVPVKPPQDWNEGGNFAMISPQSDLSNPSQFRHRIKDNRGQATVNNHPTAVAITASTARRHQAPRQTQRRSDAIPPPASFYFDHQRNESQENNPNKSTDNYKKNIKKKKNSHSFSGSSRNKWILNKQRAVKHKAKKAKRAFQGCWDEKREALEGCVRERPTPHQRLQSLTPRVNLIEQPGTLMNAQGEMDESSLKKDAPQLVLPQTSDKVGLDSKSSYPHDNAKYHDLQQKIGEIRPYIHNEEVYVDRITDKEHASLNSPPVRAKVVERTPYTNDLPAARNEDMLLIPSLGVPDPVDESMYFSDTESEQEPRRYSELEHKEMMKQTEQKENKEKIVAVGVVRYKKPEEHEPTKTADSHKASEKAEEFGRRSSYPSEMGSVSRMQASNRGNRASQETTKSLPTLPTKIENDKTTETAKQRTTAKIKSAKEAKSKTKDAGNRENVEPYSQRMPGEKNQSSESVAEQNHVPATMSQMLLQTYPIAHAFYEGEDKSKTVIESYDETSARNLGQESPHPATTPMTPMSDSSKGMVSKEAIKNASFLFSPSYAKGDQTLLKLPAPHKGATPLSISTAGSRYRLISQPRSDPNQYSHQDASNSEQNSSPSSASARRVHFSGPKTESGKRNSLEDKTKGGFGEIRVPPIERNLSDLTDATGHTRESVVSNSSNSHQISITPIPEEDASCENASEKSSSNKEEPVSVSSTSSSTLEYPTNWSIAMDNGVTPLRSGKSTNNATHSPFIRFKEAKKKFSGENGKKLQPVKRGSPIRKREMGGLVQSRVFAMEEKASNRRDTSGSISGSSRMSHQSKASSIETNIFIKSETSLKASLGYDADTSRASAGSIQSTRTSGISHSSNGTSQTLSTNTSATSRILDTSKQVSVVSQAMKEPRDTTDSATENDSPIRAMSKEVSALGQRIEELSVKCKLRNTKRMSSNSTSTQHLGETVQNDEAAVSPESRQHATQNDETTTSSTTTPHSEVDTPENVTSPKDLNWTTPVHTSPIVSSPSSQSTAQTVPQAKRSSINENSAELQVDETHNDDDNTSADTQQNQSSIIQNMGQQRISAVSKMYESEMETTVDDFAALLMDENSEDDGDDEESGISGIDEATVSTVRQMHEVERMVSGEPRFSVDNESVSTTSTTTQKQDLVADNSTKQDTIDAADNDSECTASTITHEQEVAAKRDTINSVTESSTLSSMMNDDESSFRFKGSGTVRPNEQQFMTATAMPMVPIPGGGGPLVSGGVPVPVSGGLYLSPTQKTPMQAKKWRALAAKAQQKDSMKSVFGGKRRSLSERDTNVWK